MALKNLVLYNVEITTTGNYDRWLAERWGIPSSRHHNRSEPILPNIEARRLYDSVFAASQEDRKLYKLVSWALQQTGTASITGEKLVQLLGPLLAEALSTNECPSLPAGPNQVNPDQTIHVAESKAYVEMYLAPVTLVIPDTPQMETVVASSFGKGADGDRYRPDGLGGAGKGFYLDRRHMQHDPAAAVARRRDLRRPTGCQPVQGCAAAPVSGGGVAHRRRSRGRLQREGHLGDRGRGTARVAARGSSAHDHLESSDGDAAQRNRRFPG